MVGILHESEHEGFPIFGELNISKFDDAWPEGLRDFIGKDKISKNDLGLDLFDDLLIKSSLKGLQFLEIGKGLLRRMCTRV